MRLVNADDVKQIICKYENRLVQRTIIYEIEKLKGVVATPEQLIEITGDSEINFDKEVENNV